MKAFILISAFFFFVNLSTGQEEESIRDNSPLTAINVEISPVEIEQIETGIEEQDEKHIVETEIDIKPQRLVIKELRNLKKEYKRKNSKIQKKNPRAKELSILILKCILAVIAYFVLLALGLLILGAFVVGVITLILILR
jgi:Flp pilus assembly protein TadB